MGRMLLQLNNAPTIMAHARSPCSIAVVMMWRSDWMRYTIFTSGIITMIIIT